MSKYTMFKKEYLGRSIVTACGFLMIILTLSIGAFLFYKGIGTFTKYHHSVTEFLFSQSWSPADDFKGGGKVGAAIYIFGSISTCLLALLIITPFCLASAIFLTEIAPKKVGNLFRSAVEIFVGIPSVIYGWIGLTVLVPFMQKYLKAPLGFSVLAAGIVLAVMIFPSITGVAADAIGSVPNEYKQAAYGLGSTRWQTICRVVLPSAKSGILTGIILGLARAFGEALAVAMVIGKMRAFPKNILSPTTNMTVAIASDMGGAAEGGEYNTALWTMALLLFIISLIFIFLVHYISWKGAEKIERNV
ncbi:MAG: phosphate ABC transporter permease subunit PstC [Anaerocolumna sp.]